MAESVYIECVKFRFKIESTVNEEFEVNNMKYNWKGIELNLMK